jgi:transposase
VGLVDLGYLSHPIALQQRGATMKKVVAADSEVKKTPEIAVFVGLDIHKDSVSFCMLDPRGKLIRQGKMDCRREVLQEFAKALPSATAVAMECTFHTWEIVKIIKPFVARVVVSNPLQTKAIASAKKKTDKIDAHVLADLLRCDYLPEVWQPDETTREMRRLSVHATNLTRMRTTIANRIRAILNSRLIRYDGGLSTVAAREFFLKLELDPQGRTELDCQLRLLDKIETEIKQAEIQQAQKVYDNEDIRLAITMPGVDIKTALGVLAAWGDRSRFPDADHAASYLGITPSVSQSANNCFYGSITKAGSSQARWLLVEAARQARNSNGPLGHFYRRIAQRRGTSIAVVALAHKMALILFTMLENREPYRYAEPQTVQAKLAKLRVRATGERRKGGTPKGEPRPENYGKGEPVRRIPALNDTCEKEAVPPAKTVEQLPDGEIRFLKKTRLLQHAKSVQMERTRPRAKKATVLQEDTAT